MGPSKIPPQTTDGRIPEASNDEDSFDSENALPNLALICMSVAQNNFDCTDTDIFLRTCKYCEKLPSLTAKDRENFLLSLYHIIKYFIKNKYLDKILKLFSFIEKYAINVKYKSTVYNHYIVLLHNHIFVNAKDLDGDLLYRFVKYAIDFNFLLNEVDSNVISKIKIYTTLFRHPNLTSMHCNDFTLRVLEVLEELPASENQNIVKDIYIVLLNVLSININCLSGEINFPDFIRPNFKKTCDVMRKHCSRKEYMECIDILEDLSQTLIKDLKERGQKDLNILTACNKKLKALTRKRDVNLVIGRTVIQISKTFKQLLEYYQTCKQLWADHFPVPIQIELLEMIEVLGKYLSKNPVGKEKCCEDCNLQTDIYHATILTSCSTIFANSSLRLNMPCSEEFYNLNLRCLTICCKYLTKLFEKNCAKYVLIWRIVGTGIYNIAVVLFRNKNYEFARAYSGLFIKYVTILENENPELCFPNSLGAALHLYGVCCSFLEEKKESLLYLCLTMLLSTEYRKKALNSWIKLKANDPDNEEGIKSTNVYHILFNQQEEIKKIYPAYEYNEKDCEDLLMKELWFYNEQWRSKIPMSSVCYDLCKISKNTVSRTVSFVLCWDKIYSDSNLIELINETIEIIGETSNTNARTCLSVLYFILYQCKMDKIIKKNLADINEANIPLKSTPLLPYEEPPNPNDKCDIVPDYFSMKIDNLLQIYKILDKALEIWQFLIQNKHELDQELVLMLNICYFIKLTAYEYRQQLYNIKMMETWILYYQFSKCYDSKSESVVSIGFILEYSDCKSEIVKALEEEAKEILYDFDLNDPYQLNVFLTYYINKSSGCLRNDLLEEGCDALKIAEKYLEEAREKDLRICEARILHLKTRYLMLPCSYHILSHDENFLVTALNSYVAIGEHYTQSSKCAYLMSVLLEISLFNGWMYKWLRLPREVRCYSKDSTLLAQKNALTLQTAHFLSLLAFTDLLDLQYADCEVKLNGLTNILCYTSNIPYEKRTAEAKKVDEKLETSDGDFSELNQSLTGIQTVLEAPTPSMNQNNYMSSPILSKKPFALPEFVKHPDNCECFMCSNCEYKKLVLDVIHIEALLTFYQNIGNHGKEYFRGGLAIYKNLNNKPHFNYYESLKFSESKNIPVCVNKNIANGYCTFLLDYTYFLGRKNNFSEANKNVDHILELIGKNKGVNSYFWYEVIMQKYNLIDIEKETCKMSNTSPNFLQVPTNNKMAVTPENKISQAHISSPNSPLEVSKPVKSFKKLKFDLSEDEKEDNLPKTPENDKNIFFKSRTPAKTPAAPKIKVYSPKTVKPKRTISKAPTSARKATNTKIEERMKLLTEKLKSETKALKGNKAVNDKENNVPKTTSRKKLLLDLSEVTESVEKLSLNSEKKKLKETQNLKNPLERKKYTRIKTTSTSSSSDSSVERNEFRRSTRNKRT